MPSAVGVSYEENYPTNWEFVGMVILPNGKHPDFIMIDDVIYEKK